MSRFQQQADKVLCALLLTYVCLEGTPRQFCFLQKVPQNCVSQELLAQCRRGFRYILCFLFQGLYVCICLFQDGGRNQQENKTDRRLRLQSLRNTAPLLLLSQKLGTGTCTDTLASQCSFWRAHPLSHSTIQRISTKSLNTAEH